MNERTRSASVDYALLLLWSFISALLFALLFFGTVASRYSSLARSIDSALSESGDPRRTAAALPTRSLDGLKALRGMRFSLKDKKGFAVVFTIDASVDAGTYVAVLGNKGELSLLLRLGSPQSAGSPPGALALIYAHGIAVSEARK